MYKPKSPMGSSKAINFSPSPQSRRKINYAKQHLQQQNIIMKQRLSATPPLQQKQQKQQRKSTAARKTQLKNIEVDSNELMQSLKINDCFNNNQTPKFCLKPQQNTVYGISPNPSQAPFNFFSFGQKYHDKSRLDKKNKELSQKEIIKSPKQVRKKQANQITSNKSKLEIGVFETSNRYKKSNQAYLR